MISDEELENYEQKGKVGIWSYMQGIPNYKMNADLNISNENFPA